MEAFAIVMLEFGLGVLWWTFVEYEVHRALHEFGVQDHLLGHHGRPGDYSLGPSWLAVIGYLLAWGVGFYALGVMLAYAGFLLGFVLYAGTHYLCHHRLRYDWQPLKWLRVNHNFHHYQYTECNFGVSSPLWDIVFGTYWRRCR